MGTLLKRLFDDMNRTGRRYVFTGGGDSTFNRGNGMGEWGAILEQAKAYAPCVGGFGGLNVSASGMNYLWAMKRQGITAVGATTAPADAECLGGVVCPTGWAGYQHCLLAAAGTTISSTNWNWTANATFMNTQGRLVASMFARGVKGASQANTGYSPFISGGSALDVSASQSGTRQLAAYVSTGQKSITGVSVANPTQITTSASHGYVTGDTVTITGTNTSATTVGTFTVTVTGATTFTIPVNVTSVTTGTGTVELVKTFTNARKITGISIHASAPTITTDSDHSYTTGDTVVLAGTNSTPAIDGTHVITVTGTNTFTVPTTTSGTGTAGFVNNNSQVGTIRRYDMESVAITSTAASGVGASACIGDANLRLGGPALFMYLALTAKDTPKGWWASKHISLGGKSLYDYIKEGLNTTNYANSIETYFKCMLLLNDPTYANSYGGCQGDVTPGGFGGADLAIGCAWFDCFMHNDVGSAGDTSSFVPFDGPSWAVESSSVITSITDAGAGASVVQLTSTSGFDASGHIHVVGGAVSTNEIITYTSIVGNELRGCTFAAYGSTAGIRVGATAVQGYKSYTATGFASNNFFWDQWLRARWTAAGGTDQNFKRFLKASNPVSDTTAVASTTVTTLLEREERHQRMIEAVRAYPPSAYSELIDPRDYVTASEVVNNGWYDPITNGVTIAVAGVTSTAGDTINLNLGSPVLGTYGVGRIGAEAIKWTGKSGNNPTGCTRGAFGTTAYDTGTASHTSGREFVECDMIHNSTVGYQEIWRRIFKEELGTRKTILNGAA